MNLGDVCRWLSHIAYDDIIFSYCIIIMCEILTNLRQLPKIYHDGGHKCITYRCSLDDCPC